MNKFCPHCGKPIKPNDSFCSHCGKPVVSSESAKQLMPKRSEIHSNRLKSKKRNIIIGVIVAVLVLIMGGWGLYQHGRNSAESTVIGGNGRLTNAEIKKIPHKQLAAWAILYADKKYGKKWGEAADDLRSGHLTIKSYSKYRFGDYEISATDGSTLYVINDQVGYLVSKDNKEITYVGNKSSYSNRSVLSQIYPEIKSENTEKNVNTWNDNLSIVTGKSDENASDQSSKTSKKTKKTVSEDKLWSSNQNDELISYMDEFGDKMHQSYEHYTGSGSLTTAAGQEYPSWLSQGRFKLSTGDHDSRDPEDMSSIDLKWNPQVTSEDSDDDTYNVVAIFNYNGKSAEQHITYLFCFYHGEPVALVDQTTNGDYTIVHATANKDLTSHFEEIANND
jgi:predicted nucleic acid-binding Zn ribbon protein